MTTKADTLAFSVTNEYNLGVTNVLEYTPVSLLDLTTCYQRR